MIVALRNTSGGASSTSVRNGPVLSAIKASISARNALGAAETAGCTHTTARRARRSGTHAAGYRLA